MESVNGSQRWASVVLTGIFLGLSFPPFPIPALAWIALVPLLLLFMRRRSGRAAFTDAYVAFLITFAVAFHWPLFHVLPGTAWLSLPALLVLPMWMAAPFGLAVSFKSRFGPAAGLAVMAAFYLLMEFGLRRGPLAFPWSLLGHTQAELFPLNRLASVGGVPALTLFVLSTNVCLALLADTAKRRPGIRATAGRASVIALPAAVLIAVALSTPSVQDPSSSLRVGIVQPGFRAEAWADVHDDTRVDTLIAQSERLPRGVDLVLWPETALPPEDALQRRLSRWTDSTGIPILTGAITAAGERRFYNSALLFRPRGAVQHYRKQRLVPFAEHVPLQERLPWLRRLAIPSGGVAGYAKGSDNNLLQIQDARFGVVICFESLFDDTARTYALRGAAMIVTLTQDGWWGRSFGYRQHLAFNRLRAIETGLPLVQASVSGMSGLIDPKGRLRHQVGWMEREAFVVDLPQSSGMTPYVRFGDWITLIALIGSAAAVAGLALRKKR